MGSPEKIVEMKYDPLGRRVAKIVTDQINPAQSYVRQFEYDGSDIVGEKNGSALIASYTHSTLAPDDVLGVYYHSSAAAAGVVASGLEGKRYYPLKDSLGSTTDLTDDTGQIVQRYEYSSFGKY
jgi:hypothetical protein